MERMHAGGEKKSEEEEAAERSCYKLVVVFHFPLHLSGARESMLF